jgi:hypothetical protein
MTVFFRGFNYHFDSYFLVHKVYLLVFCFIKVFEPKRAEDRVELFVEVEFFEIDPGAVFEVASQKVVLLALCEVVLCGDGRQVEVAVIEPGILPVDELHFLVVKEDVPGVEVMVGEDKLLGLPVELSERMKRFGVSGLERFLESVGSASHP